MCYKTVKSAFYKEHEEISKYLQPYFILEKAEAHLSWAGYTCHILTEPHLLCAKPNAGTRKAA